MLAVIAYAVVYGALERRLRTTYEIPVVSISIPTDPESIAEGRRLATVHECFSGCHGKEAEGGRPVRPADHRACRGTESDGRGPQVQRTRNSPSRSGMVCGPMVTAWWSCCQGLHSAHGPGSGRIIACPEELASGRRAGRVPRSGLRDASALPSASSSRSAQLIADTVPPPGSNDRASRPRTVPCAHHLCSVPRDQPARRLQSRFHQSGSAGRRCLFSGSVQLSCYGRALRSAGENWA